MTKQDAMTLRHFHAVDPKRSNADGTPMRVRANGACKIWKTRPEDFRLPVKHGLYSYGYIDQDTKGDWAPGDRCDAPDVSLRCRACREEVKP